MINNKTILAEQRLLCSNLKYDPLFLIKHYWGLMEIIKEHYIMRITRKLRGSHLGNKKRPNWLSGKELLDIPPSIEFEDLIARVPKRTVVFSWLEHLPYKFDKVVPLESTSDPENYFAVHRWGWLLNINLNLKIAGEGIDKALSDWIVFNANKNDPAWEPYSSCERIANLLTWLTFLPEAERTNLAPKQLGPFLTDSIKWIFSRLEYYGHLRTNNHILNNARALVMAGATLGWKSAIRVGLTIFRHMLPLLVQPNGFLRERSSHYQLIILNWILDALYFLRYVNSNYQFDIRFLENFAQRMTLAATVLCNVNGYLLACIGDISPDATPEQSAKRLAILYPEYWPNRQRSNEQSGSLDDWHWLKAGDNTILVNFPSGKFPFSFPTHGHGDFTSFVWIYKGRQILCDTGRYRYTKDEISDYQKSALGHNVPIVNNLAPMCEGLTSGGWIPIPYARAMLKAIHINDNTLRISHDGFKRGKKVTCHLREITLKNNALYVRDKFEGSGTVNICLRWQFGPGWVPLDTKRLTLIEKERQTSIDIENKTVPLQFEWLSAYSDGGWFSHSYGHVHPNTVLSFCWTGKLPFETQTIFKAKTCAV